MLDENEQKLKEIVERTREENGCIDEDDFYWIVNEVRRLWVIEQAYEDYKDYMLEMRTRED